LFHFSSPIVAKIIFFPELFRIKFLISELPINHFALLNLYISCLVLFLQEHI